MKLTIELVPKTAWYSNVRSNVTKHEWDLIRNKCYVKASHKCELCKDVGTNQGVKHKVECHEIFEYDDINHIQKLTQLIALCPYCHKVKHPGLAEMNGEIDIVIAQLIKVNNMSDIEAKQYIKDSFKMWKERSKYNWKLDISCLQNYLNS